MADELFNSTILDVKVPEEVIEFPEESDVDEWLESIAVIKQREKAFFDERLQLLFIVKIPHSGGKPINPAVPPLELALFLSHLQVTLDAKYIAPQSSHNHQLLTSARGINFAPPPRSHSYLQPPLTSVGAQPPIFPPYTPHPTPLASEADRKYAGGNAQTEGTVLESFVWGEKSREESSGRNFALMWSSAECVWVVIYRLTIGVSFLRTNAPEPLLSLTVSATLREKPLVVTQERKIIASLVEAARGTSNVGDQSLTVTVNGDSLPESSEELHGLEEVNLLDTLSLGPTFGTSSGVTPPSFPSTRLSTTYRHDTYSLPPVRPLSPNGSSSPTAASSASAARGTTPVLRKSFLKTLQTVSGFQIRMKSVFVPYVIIPGCAEDEGERREAGSEERTVVLSIELGSGATLAGPGSTGFAVEGIDVTVGGEGARANLIGWGDNGFQKSDAVFPLLMRPAEQFNLLYAITFLRQSAADDVADTLRSEANGERPISPDAKDMQRPVAIVIHGKPFDIWSSTGGALDSANDFAYPTQTFRSRWNCVLDLSTAGHTETFDVLDPPSTQDALPAPASPFPAMTPVGAKFPSDKATPVAPQHRAVAGSKRHTFGGLSERGQRQVPLSQHRTSTPTLHTSYTGENSIFTPAKPSAISGRLTPAIPSITIPANTHHTNPIITTALPPHHHGPRTPGIDIPPPTPAYPAYPTDTIPQTPIGQSPISGLRISGAMGPAIEPRRERMATAGTPQTPGPRILGTSFTNSMAPRDGRDARDPVVISVGLIPPDESTESDIIYTLDKFGIEIFVFNRSERTRRFEVSYPDKRRRRDRQVMNETYAASMGESGLTLAQRPTPSLLPLENRIRVGPLRPHTCQSVRMQFLALRAGVHSISSLMLTDVETGYSMNLRSVMDVVINEPSVT